MQAQEVENLIKQALPDAKVHINAMAGTHNHLEIMVASDHFQDLSLIEQHQKIMDVLKAPLGDRTLHAVKLKTMLLKDYQG